MLKALRRRSFTKLVPKTGRNCEHTVIGWREFAAFPDWGVKKIRVKIDTGARSSAIDVSNVKRVSQGRVQFDLILSRKNRERKRRVTAWLVRKTTVKSSFGERQERYIVRGRVKIGSWKEEIEIGLVERKGLLCRMLLGRNAIKNNFIVDPKHRYLLSGKEK